MNQNENLGDAVAAYLSQRWNKPVAASDCQQIHGGASRETYRVQLTVDGSPRGVIFRRDPPSSLIDTERAHEFRTYAAVYPTQIPVPEPIALEEDNPGELKRPFSIAAEITGCETSPALLHQPPFTEVRQTLGKRKWTILGKLAALDIDKLTLDFMERPTHPAKHELDYWSRVIANDALHPQPIAQATIRWLERNLPPPTKRLCLVHGDYRSGNFLYNANGDIQGILDWEMAHIGDPLEDLAWSMDPLWSMEKPELAGALLPREQALEIWAESSGMEVDRQAFRWWQIFASLKALAIWISSAEDYLNGTTKEPILAMAGWPLIDRQSRILLDRLQPGHQTGHAETLL